MRRGDAPAGIDGARIAVGSAAGTVFELEAAALRPIGRWHTDPLGFNGLRYSPDGDRILVVDIVGETHALPSTRDPAALWTTLWQTNRACLTPAERQRG